VATAENKCITDSDGSVVIIGNGGHSRSCVDAWDERTSGKLLGCTGFDENEPSEIPYLGTDVILEELHSNGTERAFVALGDNRLRAKVSANAMNLGFQLVPLVSRTAHVAQSAVIGAGTAVLHKAVVGAFARVGEGAIINTGASVDHDCEIGDFVHIGPGSHLAGNVKVGSGSFLGVGVSVIPGVSIGAGVTVGAGAVIIRDVPAGATVYGVPAK